MARSILLKGGEVVSASNKYLASGKHLNSAQQAIRLLEEFTKEVEIKKIQIPKGEAYTCWYVSIIGSPSLPIINLTLQNNGALNVEFRYMQFINPKLRESLQWQTNNWVYARIKETGYSVEDIVLILKNYIPRCINANEQSNLKKGGTSAAEVVIDDILSEIYKEDFIHGIRPEWLRNIEGNLLELDFLLEHSNIAIEVQGPHHKTDFFGKPEQLEKRQEKDQFKISTCLENNISLIWMDSEGIQKQLARISFQEQKREIQSLIAEVQSNHPCHLIWDKPLARMVIRKSI